MNTSLKDKERGLLKNLIPRNTLPEKSLNQLLSGKVSLRKDGNEVNVAAGNTEAARFALAHQFPRQLSARVSPANIQSVIMRMEEIEVNEG